MTPTEDHAVILATLALEDARAGLAEAGSRLDRDLAMDAVVSARERLERAQEAAAQEEVQPVVKRVTPAAAPRKAPPPASESDPAWLRHLRDDAEGLTDWSIARMVRIEPGEPSRLDLRLDATDDEILLAVDADVRARGGSLTFTVMPNGRRLFGLDR